MAPENSASGSAERKRKRRSHSKVHHRTKSSRHKRSASHRRTHSKPDRKLVQARQEGSPSPKPADSETVQPMPQKETPNKAESEEKVLPKVMKAKRLTDEISTEIHDSSDSDDNYTDEAEKINEPFMTPTLEDANLNRKSVEQGPFMRLPHSPEDEEQPAVEEQTIMYYPAIQGCRSVEEFSCLNRIEEGTYGVVYRAKDKKTGEIVALKRLKMEKEKEGFPITSLREISTLLKAQHENVVVVREIVVGSNMDKIYIVMEYVEHDLKSLMQYSMKKPFLIGEVKTLMIQLLRGVEHLHSNWIVHRDLKTSNLLLSHKGILKIGDFGLAREYGSPLKPYTPVVVTLWYRAPELLLGTKLYSISIDMWSVGCIFGELLLMKALFPGKSEIDQLNLIFKDLGTPSERIWTGYNELPGARKAKFTEFPYNTLRSRFNAVKLSNTGFELMNKLLTYDPKKRITAEDALQHEFFNEAPLPVNPSLFPTWPARSEGCRIDKNNPAIAEPKPPSGGKMFEKLMGDEDGFQIYERNETAGFTLKF